MWYHLAMAGIQVLRIESRRTLDGALVDHIAGTTRPETARKVPEPVVALGGVGLEAGRAVINEHRPRGRGRPPHHAVEFVLGGAPPYGSDPWDKEREREFADACYEWACGVLGPRSVIVSAALHRDETSPHVHVLAVPIDSTGALRWKGVRDEAADQLGVPRRGRKLAGAYRAFQDSFHAGVGRPFGLGRGEVGSKAKHEQIDRAKAAELRRDEAEQAADAADERATESRELLGRRDELREEAAELLGRSALRPRRDGAGGERAEGRAGPPRPGSRGRGPRRGRWPRIGPPGAPEACQVAGPDEDAPGARSRKTRGRGPRARDRSEGNRVEPRPDRRCPPRGRASGRPGPGERQGERGGSGGRRRGQLGAGARARRASGERPGARGERPGPRGGRSGPRGPRGGAGGG